MCIQDYTVKLNNNEAISTGKKILVEKLPGVYEFLYHDDKQVSPTAVEAMAEEREIRQGWFCHPQIGVSSGQSVIDVGSRYGEYTLMALALGADHVYAFDKSLVMTQCLRDNLRINSNAFMEKCSVINKVVSPIGLSIDNFVFNVCSSPPKNVKWIKIDVGGQDEINVVNGCYKTIDHYRPINVLIHHYDGANGPRIFGEQFLSANSFDCKLVSIQLQKDENECISTTTIY